MKKFRFIVIFAIILTAFFAQSAMALMEETEGFAQGQSQKKITSIKQVKLFDLQTMEMVNLEYLLEDKVTLITFISLRCPGCKELSGTLTEIQQFLENNEEIAEKVQIIGIVMVPFVREKITDEDVKALKSTLRAYFNLFVDVASGNEMAKNIKFLVERFFVVSFPHFVLIESNRDDYNLHIVEGEKSFDWITKMITAFSDRWSPFMKGLKED